jgi:hypothetical protein
LIEGFNVMQESPVQATEQGTQLHPVSVLQAMRGLENFGQHAMVLGAMLLKVRKSGLLHELLLAPEVHARELDELIQQLADPLAPGSAHQRKTQSVDGVHEDSVLIVHGAHAHVAGVVPGEKSHMSLRKFLKKVSDNRRDSLLANRAMDD